MNKKKRIKIRKTTFVIAILALGCVAFFGLSSFIKQQAVMAELALERKALLEKLEEVKRDKEDLQKTYENWNTPENIERIAREEFGYVKADEYIFKD